MFLARLDCHLCGFDFLSCAWCDIAQHLAPVRSRSPINANRMLFAELATKRSSPKRSKFFWPQKIKRRSLEQRSQSLKVETLQAIALIRAARRDTRRAAAFLVTMRLVAPRWISGCALRSAAAAAFLSPPLIASSTFLIEPRTRLRRAAFAAVPRSLSRARLAAHLWLALLSA